MSSMLLILGEHIAKSLGTNPVDGQLFNVFVFDLPGRPQVIRQGS
jgi:hypothetical protein